MLYDLSDDQWEIIKDILPGKIVDRGSTGYDNRGFVKAVCCKNWSAMESASFRIWQMAYSS